MGGRCLPSGTVASLQEGQRTTHGHSAGEACGSSIPPKTQPSGGAQPAGARPDPGGHPQRVPGAGHTMHRGTAGLHQALPPQSCPSSPPAAAAWPCRGGTRGQRPPPPWAQGPPHCPATLPRGTRTSSAPVAPSEAGWARAVSRRPRDSPWPPSLHGPAAMNSWPRNAHQAARQSPLPAVGQPGGMSPVLDGPPSTAQLGASAWQCQGTCPL